MWAGPVHCTPLRAPTPVTGGAHLGNWGAASAPRVSLVMGKYAMVPADAIETPAASSSRIKRRRRGARVHDDWSPGGGRSRIWPMVQHREPFARADLLM